MIRGCLVAILFCLSLLQPSPGRAFSDVERFSDGGELGGGGGRFFTGAPGDGYSCAVCHRGAEASEVSVRGLPSEGYVPGTTYQVQVFWDPALGTHGMNAELTDTDGRAAGSLLLADETGLGPGERCGQLATGEVATRLQEPGERSVLSVSSCGSAGTTFFWVAPQSGEVELNASVVRANGDGAAQGDAVMEISQRFERLGAPRLDADAEGGCSLSPASAGSSATWLWLLALWVASRVFDLVVTRRAARPVVE